MYFIELAIFTKLIVADQIKIYFFYPFNQDLTTVSDIINNYWTRLSKIS